MKLLNTLLLLVKSTPPSTGVAPGAVYYDSTNTEPRWSDGTSWYPFGTIGFPDPANGLVVPDGKQVLYFDKFTNDGVLTITGSGQLVGMR